jgi:hypothetical protein
LAPKRRAAQPLTGMTAASDSMYPVTTHWIWSIEALSLWERVASATLTIVVSRIDMIDPITTTALTRHTWALMPFCSSVIDIPFPGSPLLSDDPFGP